MTAVVRRTSAHEDVRIDTHGLEWVVADDTPVYVTPCCDASAKGSAMGASGVVCRACYADVDPSLGGVPVPHPDDDRPQWRESRRKLAEFLNEVNNRSLGLGE